MPVYESGLVFFYTGYEVDEVGKFANLLAVNPDGAGNITESHVAWKLRTKQLHNQMLTPVIREGLIHTVNTDGQQQCIDAKSGEVLWTRRVKGKYNASPIYADGKLYFCSTRGKVMVFKHGPEYELMAENTLEGEIWTTPAILRDQILIRTSKYLYLIGN
ncbi:MAG: PQQ-like beta-propeller repeat protein [Bacteroidetes bacterium]|nr:PQQ-like beta-propeller repeat protein [Bacteroidota bacterium]